MITVYNANNIAQQFFFKKAFAALQEKGIGSLNEQELAAKRFLSLDGYFAHMHDLILIDPVYAMLPSDEEPFVIDANARTITIPAGFNKCASVAGDDMCEIATFVVDRYYDYVDLANTNICIQWATKSNEGISHVTLIDTESIPGKIRFGWPLTSALTAEPGAISFAVRFFVRGDNETIDYVLNTLKSSIVVREGLQLKGDNITVESNNDLFTAFVKNSNKPSYPIPAPISWGKPGSDLLGSKKIAEEERVDLETGIVEAANSLVMRAQAIVADNGHLMYEWYFKSDDADSQIEKLSNDDERYNITEEFVLIEPHPVQRNGSEQYFVKNGSGYELAIGDLPTDDLYERYTVLTIDPASSSQNITGEYWVEASNYVGDSYISLGVDSDTGEVIKVEAQNHSTPSSCTHCKVLGPVEVVFKDKCNLTTDKFLDKNGKAELAVETVADAGTPLLRYGWYYSDELLTEIPVDESGVPTETEDKMSDIENTKSSIEVTTPGWYYVHVNSKLNRKEKNAVSTICRVVNDPVVPQLDSMQYAPWTDAAFENEKEYFAREDVWNIVDKEHEMGDNVVNRQGDVTRLRVNFKLDESEDSLSNKLLTDNITYQWYVITPDNNTRLIEEADADVLDNGLVLSGCPVDTNYLDVRCIQNQTKYSYFCVVTNHLVDKTAKFGKDDYEVIFQIW